MAPPAAEANAQLLDLIRATCPLETPEAAEQLGAAAEKPTSRRGSTSAPDVTGSQVRSAAGGASWCPPAAWQLYHVFRVWVGRASLVLLLADGVS